MVTFANQLQPSKAPPPIRVTESGTVTSANELPPPIRVSESGTVTSANELQHWKAHSPMSVTEWGRVTLANELQNWKASRSILVKLPGISTTRKSPGTTPEACKLEHFIGLMLRKATLHRAASRAAS